MKARANRSIPMWETLSSELAFQTQWFCIHKKSMKTPNGGMGTYYIHEEKDSALCVCVNDNDEILIERQHRPPIDAISIDYPAGGIEPGEHPEEAMLRELKEETGYAVESCKKLAVIDKDPGRSTSRMHIYLAKGLVKGNAQQEDTESIAFEFVPAKTVLQLVESGEMACSFCVSATLFAFRELGWLQTNLPDA